MNILCRRELDADEDNPQCVLHSLTINSGHLASCVCSHCSHCLECPLSPIALKREDYPSLMSSHACSATVALISLIRNDSYPFWAPSVTCVDLSSGNWQIVELHGTCMVTVSEQMNLGWTKVCTNHTLPDIIKICVIYIYYMHIIIC